MANVSTAATLLASVGFEDIANSLLPAADEEASSVDGEKKSLWKIPGMGVVGLGAATVSLVLAYNAFPGIKEKLSEFTDVLGGDPGTKKDADLDKVGEQSEKHVGKQPDEEPKAEVKRLPVEVAKAGVVMEPPVVTVPQQAVAPIKYTEPNTHVPVSRGSQIQTMTPSVAAGSGQPVDPKSRLARPSAEIEAILRKTSKNENIDYGTLYAVVGSESSFSAGATAKNSSATGLLQFTSGTWNYLITKVYPELGYTPEDRTNPEKAAIMGSRYIKSIQASLQKKLGRAPTLGQTYLGYFMGPTGASNFIDAHSKNPNAKGAEVFPKAAEANPQLFYEKGNKNEPLTLQQTMDRLEGKVTRYYAQSQQATVPSVAETAPPIKEAKIAPMKATIDAATTKPAVQEVKAPDFSAAPGGAKGEQRDTSAPKSAQGGKAPPDSTGSVAMEGSKAPKGEVMYTRAKNGQLISIRG